VELAARPFNSKLFNHLKKHFKMKLNFLPALQRMPYLDYYGNCVEDGLDSHVCQNCLSTSEEHANISAGAWVHKNRYAALIAAPLLDATWQDGIDAGEIIVLPELRGSFDGGTPKIGAGWGRNKGTYIGSDFKATINDRVYQDNWAHYRSLVGKTNWHFAYITETQGHITSVPVTVAPKNPITENVDDVISWQSDVTWFEYFTPAPFDAPLAIFECIPT
jgi:hypothetical protein